MTIKKHFIKIKLSVHILHNQQVFTATLKKKEKIVLFSAYTPVKGQYDGGDISDNFCLTKRDKREKKKRNNL